MRACVRARACVRRCACVRVFFVCECECLHEYAELLCVTLIDSTTVWPANSIAAEQPAKVQRTFFEGFGGFGGFWAEVMSVCTNTPA